jgi:putative ABC transport system permease protein
MARWPRPLFWQLLLRSLSVRRPQAVLALGALAVGAAVTSMLFNLYGDVRRKMSREFRAYGANVLLVPASLDATKLGGVMPEDALGRLEPIQERLPGLAAAPVLYAVLRLGKVPGDPRQPEFQNGVVVGTDFAALRGVFPSSRVEGSGGALAPGTCAIGAQVATRLHIGIEDRLELETLGSFDTPPRRQEFQVSRLVTTGASEDDQVFLPLLSLQRLTGLDGKVSLVELSVPGGTREVERVIGVLARTFPDLAVRPIRQIVYSEGRVLGLIRTLMASLTGLILVIIALCVAATMTAIVLERGRDIAVMKALGAGDRTVLELFLGEAAGLGLTGGALGCVLGGFAARYLAERLFGVTLQMVWWTFPLVCLLSILVALAATSFPMRIVRGVQPAAVLKGE